MIIIILLLIAAVCFAASGLSVLVRSNASDAGATMLGAVQIVVALVFLVVAVLRYMWGPA